VRVVGTYTEGLVREVGFKGYVDSFIAFNDISTFMEPVTDPPVEPVVMFVGVLESYKGVDVLLHAWADVVKQVPQARLRLVGEGNLRANLIRLTQELDVSASVEFLGRIPREQMPSMFDSARMLVLPSRSEGLGLVVIEAMARGRPIVATAVGGIVELVHEGVGRLVAPDDPTALGEAISSLLIRPGESQSLGLVGRREVSSMSESGSFAAGIDRLRSWVQGE
jgi:glycosyltransferase involved in cell wall biosynthesis